MQEFEYNCDRCGKRFSEFRGIGNAPVKPNCPNPRCHGHGIRLHSTFVIGQPREVYVVTAQHVVVATHTTPQN